MNLEKIDCKNLVSWFTILWIVGVKKTPEPRVSAMSEAVNYGKKIYVVMWHLVSYVSFWALASFASRALSSEEWGNSK